MQLAEVHVTMSCRAAGVSDDLLDEADDADDVYAAVSLLIRERLLGAVPGVEPAAI